MKRIVTIILGIFFAWAAGWVAFALVANIEKPLFRAEGAGGNCDRVRIINANQAEQGAKEILSSYRFHLVDHLFKNPEDVRAGFASNAYGCSAREGGYSPDLLGKYWIVSCYNLPVWPSCGPLMDVTFQIGACGATDDILPMQEHSKCPTN